MDKEAEWGVGRRMNAVDELVYTLLLMSWLSMDASNGFHSFDSNSICFYQLRDDSPNDHHPPLFQLPFADYHYERSLNFADLPLLCDPPLQDDPSSPKLDPSPPEEDSPEWKHTGGSTRKGLKWLAELLVKMLRKRPLQQGEIVPLIEAILCKGKQEEGGKEEKNVKRRIYDALNVMIAAGLLEKEGAEIRIKKSEPSSVLLELEPVKLFEDIQARVDKKRELLGRLASKRKALDYWIRRNRGRPSGESKGQLIFPLIFVLGEEDSFWMHYLKDCILMKANSLHLFSETDIIESMHNLQTGSQTSLCPDME